MHAGGGCASRAHRAAPCAAATLARSRCPSELVSRHGCRGEGGAPARCHPAWGRKFLDGVRCAAATPDTAATSSAASPVAQRLSIPVGGREVRIACGPSSSPAAARLLAHARHRRADNPRDWRDRSTGGRRCDGHRRRNGEPPGAPSSPQPPVTLALPPSLLRAARPPTRLSTADGIHHRLLR